MSLKIATGSNKIVFDSGYQISEILSRCTDENVDALRRSLEA